MLQENGEQTDILTKNTGSTNNINVVKAVMQGLESLRDPATVARQRGISVKEKCISELYIHPDAMEDHIITWVKQDQGEKE